MITSLNVNNFVGQKNWIGLQGKFECKSRIWRESLRDYYFSYIKDKLASDEDVVILHEVPYINEAKYTDGWGRENYRRIEIKESNVRDNHLNLTYKELVAFCKSEDLEVLISESSETSFFATIAICKKGTYEVQVLPQEFKDYRKRIIVINEKKDPGEIIIGVHANDDDAYWEQLISLFKTLDMNKNEKKIVIIGDLNVYLPGTPQKRNFHKLLSEGLFDAWIEAGKSNFDSTFVARTRIDYALVSDNGIDSYEVYKDDSIRSLRKSDHSAITLARKQK